MYHKAIAFRAMPVSLAPDLVMACCPEPGKAKVACEHSQGYSLPVHQRKPPTHHTDLKRGGDLVPSKMLALMSAIEKAAPSFISRMLITIPSGC